MFLTIEKFEGRVAELGRLRYFGHESMAPFISMRGELPQDAHYHQIPDRIRGPQYRIGDLFEGRDGYLWLDKEVTIPKAKDGCEVVGLFNFGIDGGGGCNKGIESLLYLDGAPFQGVDPSHSEVLFKDYEEKTVRMTFLLWTGLEGWNSSPDYPGPREFHHRFTQADFAYLHKKADELYYFAKAITATLKILEKSTEVYEDLLHALDKALNLVDWDETGEVLYTSVDEAHESLMKSLDKLEKYSNVTVHAVGHAHIDVAWLWRLKHTREKAQRSFSTVLRLMELYDEYIFLQSQPQLYKYIKEDCPQLYERIQQRVQEGRWEADGGMWIEADCNVTSGESLVRQLLYGTRFIEREFGRKCEYLWLPDVFGYSWVLPQILKQCEIDTFMTTKISWNQYNKIPNDIFWWRGIDGSEILTYFIDVPGEWDNRHFSTYNSALTVEDVVNSWKAFKNKELTKDVLVCYGYGDGGGGVNREMLEMRRVMDALPGLPHVKTGRAGDFFRKIHENVEKTERYVPTWDGELYLEFHRGTYTTQAYNKTTNRRLENKLAQMEWIAALGYILNGQNPQKALQEGWECVLLHQFHDIIPGSSIHEVYQDSRINYKKAEETVDRAMEPVLEKLIHRTEDIYTIYTTNSFGGKELVKIPETREGYFTEGTAQPLPAQKTEDGYLVQMETLPFGMKTIRFHPTEKDVSGQDSCFAFADNRLETPYYVITWNGSGQLTSVYDKEAKRDAIKPGQAGNVLELYEDKPASHEAWDIDIFYTQRMEELCITEAPRLLECGELQATVRFVYRFGSSLLTQDMIVYRDCRRIDFKTHIDWQETHKLLKAAFYTDIRTTKATYDIQFGHAERPNHWNTSWDYARFEVCGHKWADLSEDGYGVSLLNNCKYGYNAMNNAIKLSLLKCPRWPDPTADKGVHQFTYSLLPHIGSVTTGGTIEEANRLNLPAQVVEGEAVSLGRIVKLSSDQVQLDVVKKAEEEECLIVRMHECRGGRGDITLSSDYKLERIVPCNLLEHDCGDAVEGAEVTFRIKPFEIKNFKLYFAPRK